MATLILLLVIYVAFISLGLPDSLLGTAWPTMRSSLNLPLEAAGIFMSVSTLSTAFSSFMSGHVIKKLGTGKVTFISCVLTGSMLVGYSLAPSYVWLVLFTLPLGLGAGAVDTGLNNYVAKNFSSRHMSWLHCFWGLGASIGPNVMTYSITQANDWRPGYRIIGFIQLLLSLILLLSLPLWKEKTNGTNDESHTHTEAAKINLLRNKGVLLSIIAFPLYIGIEAGTGAWLGSLLVEGRGISQGTAGLWISLFYASITVGRFISGFVTTKLTNRQMIRAGLFIAIIGAVVFAVPAISLTLPGIILIGLGCAPVFPCMVHETPRRFGSNQSEVITGYQVGAAYLSGVTVIPLIGLLAGRTSLEAIPICVLVFVFLTLSSIEALNRIT
ncbi:MAG: MFS transporter [Clostridiaceae bacterium]|nr:MFS transporter [Clostridiaceae bacterium]